MSRQLIIPHSSSALALTEDRRRDVAAVARRIKSMWRGVPRIGNNSNLTGDTPGGGPVYGGSNIAGINNDFLGDWRSADSWMRFDLLRVRNRSRQLERGNPWCTSFKTSLLNNVCGANGFNYRPNVASSLAFGDTNEGVQDEQANAILKFARKDFERKENFTTKKRLDRLDVDRFMAARICFDGEIIMRRRPGFNNDHKFSWQIINPDYLDHNLNRLADNGNMIKMGVELDKTDKFVAAYHFLHRRPNDFFYNFNNYHPSLYYRVPAEDIIHEFIQDIDDEQTRGFPWLFSAMVNLFRMGKYEEAALINATIGASKMGFFKKKTPDGFTGDPQEDLDDNGSIVDEVEPGSWWELPWNVEPVPFNPTYPEAEFDNFSKAMLRGIASALGTSYMSLTGDVSDANYSSLRAGETPVQENWMQIQSFLIRHIKEPEYKEWVYRALLSRQVPLPIGKLAKFQQAIFTGRRWSYINPLDDAKANQMAWELRTKSISQIIREGPGAQTPEEVFKEIAKDDELLEKLGIPVVAGELNINELLAEKAAKQNGDGDPSKKKAPAPGKKSSTAED